MKQAILVPPLLWLSVVAVTAVRADTPVVADDPPAGVQQILPRGGIPALFEPEFVSAEQATIPDGAWVLGVEIGGLAKAYSLNLLNHHEVVNDRFGELPVAAVW